jgi:hypothetical protein
VVGELLRKAQRAQKFRNDIDTNDLLSLVAGAIVAEQHAGQRPARQRLGLVLLDGLRVAADSGGR